jgi:hypothetical protein
VLNQNTIVHNKLLPNLVHNKLLPFMAMNGSRLNPQMKILAPEKAPLGPDAKTNQSN